IADYDEAIKVDPNYADAYFNRGLAKRRKGDTSGYEADMARARELDPNVASVRSTPAGPLGDQAEPRLGELCNGPLALTPGEMNALRARIAKCWDVPASVRKRSDMAVIVRVKLARDGSLAGPPTIMNTNPDPVFSLAAKSVTATLQKCAPFNFMPAAKYD